MWVLSERPWGVKKHPPPPTMKMLPYFYILPIWNHMDERGGHDTPYPPLFAFYRSKKRLSVRR